MHGGLTERRLLLRGLARETLEAAPATGEDWQQALFRTGTELAPLFVGFALFIAERSRQDKVRRLLFFTREGVFFQKVFEAVLANADGALPPHGLLAVSRLATFCASLRAVSVDEMMRLWRLYGSQSVDALARSLGLDPADLASLCGRHGIPPGQPIHRPWLDERVLALFADGDFERLVADKAAGDRRRLLAYLGENDVRGDADRIGIVDIGWRGTIQDNLAYVLPKTTLHGYYLGLQRFLNPQPANCVKSAFGPDANVCLTHAGLLDAVSPMEMICNAAEGSVTGYRIDDNGRVVVARVNEPDENLVHDRIVRHVQDGVLFACAQWSGHVSEHAIRSEEVRALACERWRRLIAHPPRELLDGYAALKHNEVFGLGGFTDKRAVPSVPDVLAGIVCGAHRRKLVVFVKQTQWPAGIWRRGDLGLVRRLVLVALVTAARCYKRLVTWTRFYRAKAGGRG